MASARKAHKPMSGDRAIRDLCFYPDKIADKLYFTYLLLMM